MEEVLELFKLINLQLNNPALGGIIVLQIDMYAWKNIYYDF